MGMKPARTGAYWYCYLGTDGKWKICHHGEVLGDRVIRETPLQWFALAYVQAANHETPLNIDELRGAGFEGAVSIAAVDYEHRHHLSDYVPRDDMADYTSQHPGMPKQGVLL